MSAIHDAVKKENAPRHVGGSLKSSRKVYSIAARIRRDRYLYLLLLPVVLFFVLFRYVPMWWLSIGFMDYNLFRGFDGSEWVRFKHFVDFFTGRDFWMLIRNTLSINIGSLLLGFPAPIVFALLLNEIRGDGFKRTVQTISYLPRFLSTVVVVGMTIAFLSPSTGPVNQVRRFVGLDPIFFLSRAELFQPIYIISGIWQWMGWSSIIYLAALAGIDPSLYEAAIVDGAGKWRQLIHITLPSLMPTISILFVLRIGDLLEIGFERIFLLSNPTTRRAAEVVATYVYRRGLLGGEYSFATAVGLFNSVLGFLLVWAANRVAKRLGQQGIW